MKLVSKAFRNGDSIPDKYTCKGANISPPLAISEIPEGAKSLALIVDDPDAPAGTWVHWVVWNISVSTKEIPEGVKSLGVDGISDFGKPGYGGPAPPPGPSHTYCFKLYALDCMLDLKTGSSKSDLEKAMEGHIVAQAELQGEYRR